MGLWRSIRRATALPGKGIAALAPGFLRNVLNKPLFGTKTVEEQDRQLAAQKLKLANAEKSQLFEIAEVLKQLQAGIVPMERIIVDTVPKIKSAAMHSMAAEQMTTKATQLEMVLQTKERALEAGKFGAGELQEFIGLLVKLEKEMKAILPELNKVVQVTRAEEAETAKVLQAITKQGEIAKRLHDLYSQVYVEAAKGFKDSQLIAKKTIRVQQDVGQQMLRIQDAVTKMARSA